MKKEKNSHSRSRTTRVQECACIGVGLLLYLVLTFCDSQAQDPQQARYLERRDPGQGEAEYEVNVEGLEGGKTLADITLEERQYSQEEAEKVFEDILEQLPEQMRQENPSLREVRSDLKLPSWIEERGVRLTWESDNPAVLDSYGTVRSGDLKEEAGVALRVGMSDGIHTAVYVMDVGVLPLLQTEEERELADFLDQIRRLEETSREEKGIWLPEVYDGKNLHYRVSTGTNYAVLLVLGVILAFLCHAKEQVEEQKADKNRKQQLLLDYSEVVSKLMVLIGAGMTIRLAWEKMAADYAQARKTGIWPVRYAYEEISRTCGQMQKGAPEGQAFKEFGNRCALPCYLKLSSLLEQNRRSGTKNLRQLLEREMEDAFEQRKNLARKMGEEASTKLLVPLFLMLGIVMVMIIVPAFMAF